MNVGSPSAKNAPNGWVFRSGRVIRFNKPSVREPRSYHPWRESCSSVTAGKDGRTGADWRERFATLGAAEEKQAILVPDGEVQRPFDGLIARRLDDDVDPAGDRCVFLRRLVEVALASADEK